MMRISMKIEFALKKLKSLFIVCVSNVKVNNFEKSPFNSRHE